MVPLRHVVPTYVVGSGHGRRTQGVNRFGVRAGNGFARSSFFVDFYDLGAGVVNTTAGRGGVSPTFTRATTATTVLSNGLIASVATGVARSYYDPTTLEYLGYLAEGARTNVLTKSEEFDDAVWTTVTNVTVGANVAVAPDGTSTADSLTDDATNGAHRILQAYTFAAAAHSLSCFFKRSTHTWIQLVGNDGTVTFAANFDLANGVVGQTINSTSEIKEYPNGWYRCTAKIAAGAGGLGNIQIAMLSGDTGAAAPSYAGTGTTLYLWGIQLEAASFASSYIPTTTAAVTRNADVLTYPTSPWLNAAAGTIYSESQVFNVTLAANKVPFSLSDNTVNESIRNDVVTATTTFVVTDGGVQQAVPNSIVVTANSTVKIASAYAANDFAISANGGTVGTDASGTIPTVTQASIGLVGSASAFNFGPIRRVAYYAARLPNATLQALSA